MLQTTYLLCSDVNRGEFSFRAYPVVRSYYYILYCLQCLMCIWGIVEDSAWNGIVVSALPLFPVILTWYTVSKTKDADHTFAFARTTQCYAWIVESGWRACMGNYVDSARIISRAVFHKKVEVIGNSPAFHLWSVYLMAYSSPLWQTALQLPFCLGILVLYVDERIRMQVL